MTTVIFFEEYLRAAASGLHEYLVMPLLREKFPNTEFFLVRIFPRLDWIRRDTPYLSVLSPNTEKYGPEKTPYLDTFHAVLYFMRILRGLLMGDGICMIFFGQRFTGKRTITTTKKIYPANIYLLKVYNTNIRRRCEICLTLTITTRK